QDVDVSAAVHVLLDTSGSMGVMGDQLSTYGLATARALEQAELVVSVSTLPTAGNVTLLKGQHEACSAVSGRFAGISIGGGTPMAESMEVVMRLLSEAPEVGHRVMVIFTDGKPRSLDAVRRCVAENATVRFCAAILGSETFDLES